MCIFQDGGGRRLAFLIPPFWTTHDVPVAGFYVTCQWRNDQPEFVRDIAFGDFGWKMIITANFVGLGILTPLNYDVIILTPERMQFPRNLAY